MCVDYVPLNKELPSHHHPLPTSGEMIDNLQMSIMQFYHAEESKNGNCKTQKSKFMIDESGDFQNDCFNFIGLNCTEVEKFMNYY